MKKILLLPLSLFVTTLNAACPDGNTYPVTLTFDDGPHNVLTPRVLDVLKEEKVKGTFFVLGERFQGGKDNPNNKTAYSLLDRMKKEGHLIGSHTYHHLAHSKLSPESMKDNITKPNALLKDYLSPILRLPYGDGSFRSSNEAVQRKNDIVMDTVKKAGFTHVGWDIDTNDWDKKKHATLLSSTLKQICSAHGGVILFHDIQANTVSHLQEWIRAIKAQGHPIVGLDKVKNEKYASACTGPVVSKKAEDLSRDVDEITKKIK